MKLYGFNIRKNSRESKRLNRLIGKALERSEYIDYISSFNDFVNEYLNPSIIIPKSKNVLHNYAYEMQEKYNNSFRESKEKNKKHGNYELSIKTIVNLSNAKKDYRLAKKNLDDFNNRTKEIEQFIDLNENNNVWSYLQSYAEKLDNKDGGKRLEKLNILKNDWCPQKQFAHYNSEDISHLLEIIEKFEWFLDLVEHAIPYEQYTSEDKEIYKKVNQNRKSLSEIKQTLNIAIGWRIKAASLRGNMYFDDSLWALKTILNDIFSIDDQNNYRHLKSLVTIPQSVLSRKLDYDKISIFVEKLRISKHKIDRDKWFNSRWVSNSNQNFKIPLIVTNDLEIIPKALGKIIPKEQPNTIEGFIRYIYFRSQVTQGYFWNWIRNKFVRKKSSLVPIINECSQQVDLLRQSIDDRKNIDLKIINLTPGFRSALYFNNLYREELSRINDISLNSWVHSLIGWVPYFNYNDINEFSRSWGAIIKKQKTKIVSDCKVIANQIVQELKVNLTKEIKENLYSLPKDLIIDLKKFVSIYAEPELKKEFYSMVSPANLFKKFPFFLPLSEDEKSSQYRTISPEAVSDFLRYANKYWNEKQIVAAKIIAGIITGESFIEEDEYGSDMVKLLESWFLGDDTRIKATSLLNYIGKNILVKLGGRGNSKTKKFLEKYSKDGLAIWNKEKTQNLREKYAVIYTALSKNIGEELKLSKKNSKLFSFYKISIHHYEQYIGDLSDKESSRNYMNALAKELLRYVNSYDGSNSCYALLVYSLCANDDNLLPLLADYVRKRFVFLVENSNNGQEVIQENDYDLFLALAKFESIDGNNLNTELGMGSDLAQEDVHLRRKHINILSDLFCILLEKDNGDGYVLENLILTLESDKFTATYYAKRLKKAIAQYIDKCDKRAFKELFELYWKGIRIDGKDEFSDLRYISTTPEFYEETREYLHKSINDLQRKNKHDLLVDTEFGWVVDSFGDQEVLEHYRLARIKYLITLNDKRYIDAFISEYIYIEEDKDLSKFIITNKYRRKLGLYFKEVAQNLLSTTNWNGNSQFLIEKLQFQETKESLYLVRVAWFKEYLFGNNYLESVSKKSIDSQDLEFHLSNIQIPNDDIHLVGFYGKSGVGFIKQYIDDFFVEFNDNVNQRKLSRIRTYLNVEPFYGDGDTDKYKIKLKVFSFALEITDLLRSNDSSFKYEQIADLMRVIYDKIAAYKSLMRENCDDSQSNNTAEFEIDCYISVTKKIENIVLEEYKHLTIDLIALSNSDPSSYDMLIKESLQKRKILQQVLIDEVIYKSCIDDEFVKKIELIKSQTDRVIEKSKKFIENLTFTKLSKLPINEKASSLFSKCLTMVDKKFIQNRFEKFFGTLAKDPDIGLCLQSFIDDIYDDSEVRTHTVKSKFTRKKTEKVKLKRQNTERQNRLKNIERFHIRRKSIAEFVSNLLPDLEECLKNNQPLSKHKMFDSEDLGFGEGFINSLTATEYKSLETIFLHRMTRALDGAPSKDIENQISDWRHHSQLYNWIVLAKSGKSILKHNIESFVNKALVRSKKIFTIIQVNLDSILSSSEVNNKCKTGFFSSLVLPNMDQVTVLDMPEVKVVEQEKFLLRDAVFIRLFGTKKQQKSLDIILNRIINWQRKSIFQGGDHGSVKKALDFASSIISCAGNESQREENVKIMEPWIEYYRNRTESNLKKLRETVFASILPLYISNFRRKLYQYFIDKYKMKRNLQKLFLQKLYELESSLLQKLYSPESTLLNKGLTQGSSLILQCVSIDKFKVFLEMGKSDWWFREVSDKDGYRLFMVFYLCLVAREYASNMQTLSTTSDKDLYNINESVLNLFDAMFYDKNFKTYISQNFKDKLIQSLVNEDYREGFLNDKNAVKRDSFSV